MSQTFAVVTILFTAFLWGSWGQFIKRLENWTISMFMITLYGFSLFVTWGSLLIFGGPNAIRDLIASLTVRPNYLFITLAGGILYTLGMWLSLTSIRDAGLVVTNIIMPSISIVMGTVMSIFGGGLRDGTSLPLLFLGCFVLILAAYISGFGSQIDKKNAAEPGGFGAKKSGVAAAIGAGVLLSFYPTVMSLVMVGPNRPDGLNHLEYMAILSLGSAITTICYGVIPLAIKGGLGKWWRGRPLLHLYGILSGLAHYGGNILNGAAVPFVGASLAWPMGQTMALWGYVWGIAYGEFAGFSRRAIRYIYGGIALFIIGTAIFAATVYL